MERKWLVAGIVVGIITVSSILLVTDKTNIISGMLKSSIPVEAAEVYAEGDTIVYIGPTEEPGYEKFRKVMGENLGITTMIITSLGGDTKAGIKIGEVVFDNKLDVVVREHCFSSCANYVFTAGKDKRIEKGSYVGWHGSEGQSKIIGEYEGITEEEHLKKSFSEGIKEAGMEATDELVNDVYEKFMADMHIETDYFEKIGLNKNITLNGLVHIIENKCAGWTHSIEDMKKYNVKNVSYLSEEVYPNADTIKKNNICLI